MASLKNNSQKIELTFYELISRNVVKSLKTKTLFYSDYFQYFNTMKGLSNELMRLQCCLD